MCARDGWSQRNGVAVGWEGGLSYVGEVAVPGFLTVKVIRMSRDHVELPLIAKKKWVAATFL